MAFRREDASPELHILNSSTMPENPEKNGSTNMQPIYTDGPEPHLINSVNVPEPISTENLLQEFDCWQTGTVNSSVYGNLSFVNLLALAEAGGNPAVIKNALTDHNFVSSSSSSSCYHTQIEGCSHRDQSKLLETRFVNSGTSFPRHFDVNSPSKMLVDLGMSASSHLEPVTPMKNNNQGECAVQDLSVDKVLATKNNSQSETQLQENHKPDTEEADLSKTPQQKPRRRKHRPKVIIEGQKKRIPRSNVIPKSTPEKRKYVRRNKANSVAGGTNEANLHSQASETPVEKRENTRRKDDQKPMEEGISTPKRVSRYPLRSCRQSLNFNLDDQVRDESSSFPVSPKGNTEFQAENSSTPLMKEMFGNQVDQVKEPMEKKISETEDSNVTQYPRRPDKQSLDFNLEVRNENSSFPVSPKGNTEFAENSSTPMVKEMIGNQVDQIKESMEKRISETKDSNVPQYSRGSDRRSLDFNSNDQVRDGISSFSSSPTDNTEFPENSSTPMMKEMIGNQVDQVKEPVMERFNETKDVVVPQYPRISDSFPVSPTGNTEFQAENSSTPVMKEMVKNQVDQIKEHMEEKNSEIKDANVPQYRRRSCWSSDFNSNEAENSSTPVMKEMIEKQVDRVKEPMEERISEAKDANVPQYPRRSCRRVLDFNINDQVRDESSSSPNENRKFREENSSTQEMEELMTNQVDRGKEGCSSENSLPPANYKLADQIVSTRIKCQIFFSDVTHDKEVNIVQNVDSQFSPKSPSETICNNSACLTPEKQENSLKRRNTSIDAKPYNKNETALFYNPLQEYAAYLPAEKMNSPPVKLHFPSVYKRKRTEKISTPSSSLQITTSTLNNSENLERNILAYSCTKQSVSPANQGDSGGQVDNVLTTHRASGDIKSGRQLFEDLLALGPTQRIRRRRSSGPTRRRNVVSLLEDLPAFPGNAAKYSRIGEDSAIPHGPHTCMEALVADTGSAMIKKKRTKRSTPVSSLVQNFYHHQNSASTSTGSQLALNWKSMSLIDIIVEKLGRINLNASSEDSERGHNARMAYNGYYLDQPVVPYQHSGAIVPFDDQVMRKRPRPKVDLDDETNRVWKLLLENINNEGVDGTDEENAKWWEEERRVFRGRADSFIARMHLVQGDRRFSPWKGSVVDSVVGVFLTQNVSDHLSSSAFMSMAARYPLKSEFRPAELHEDNLGRKTNEPEVCELDSDITFEPNREILHQSMCGEGAKNSEVDAHKSIILVEDERDTEDALSSQTAEISSQNSTNSPVDITNSSSFTKLMQMTETLLQSKSDDNRHAESESLASNLQREDHFGNPRTSCSQPTQADTSQRNKNFADTYIRKECCSTEINELVSESACGTTFQKTISVSFEEVQRISGPNTHSSSHGRIETSTQNNKMMDTTGSTSNIDNSKGSEHKEVNSNKNSLYNHPGDMVKGEKLKNEEQVDWDFLRKNVHTSDRERARTVYTMDSVDWEAVRCADTSEIAETIKDRGMNNVLAQRIQDFLNRIVKDHGSIDLEWLRDVPPDKAKEYLLSIRGLGLKSVECVRLLTLHHLAFPVDTNVGRIAVRLGWVPLQPLPESLQLHLLELYPVLESIQKFLWPRLCKFDQKTLYELHYQMITFGKVFCTKSKPNCNACPMRGECRHFASAFASARLSLPAPQEKSIVSAAENRKADEDSIKNMNTLQLPSTNGSASASATVNGKADQDLSMNTLQLPLTQAGFSNSQPIIEEPPSPEPVIEVPATPEPNDTQVLECDIEHGFEEDPDEIPTIQLNMEEFTQNLQSFINQNTELQEFDMSKALVALTSAAASIPVPKLKNMSRLRTEHQVYELPDAHPLLQGMDKREPDDPSPYLLAIWTPGETIDSIDPPERRCSSQGCNKLCSDETCLSCNSIREANSQTVRGTILIPCRTAMRGRFPLNGTYFQVNEVFSDHESSLSPIDVPREWLWNLPRRTVYFGTSIPTIFKGLSTEGIQYCFWRGFVCVRGFDRITRAPRPLIARLHFPASKLAKGKGKIDENV